jgi:flagellar hook-associated protein 1 FlgK
MGLMANSLQIGRSAILTYQAAMQVIGNNVANAGNEDYTRQTSELDALHGVAIGRGLQPGAGVALTSIKRNLDEALETRIRSAIGEWQSADTENNWIARIETFFDEMSGAGLSNILTEFFMSLDEVQNTPEDLALRGVAISSGVSLAGAVQRLRTELLAMGEEADDQIGLLIEAADGLTEDIADLNSRIVAAEASGTGQAGALRDQRDAKLRDLSELFDVTVRIQPDNSVYVYIGSEAVVLGGISRGLTTEQTLDGSVVRSIVRFGDTNSQVPINGGKIGGLLQAREEQAYGRIDDLDNFAAALIAEVNRVHADGQGLAGMTDVSGTNDVTDTSAALNSTAAGLRNPPRNGSFFITVYDDATSTPVAYQINVDLDGIGGDDTSLESLVDDINATVTGVAASITPDGRLALAADTGYTFRFGTDGRSFREDTSHVLAALGINTFFEGTGAGDIRVNDVVVNNANFLAASTTGIPGDGSNAGRLVAVLNAGSDLLDGLSILEGYNEIASDVAVAGAAAKSTREATGAVLSSLEIQKENISGVSLDEEAVELLKYERAYQGAARYLSVVDQMLAELMNVVR